MYTKRINPTDESVSTLLEAGYLLHSVTPVYTQNSSHYGGNSGKTDLIYHFIKNEVQQPMSLNAAWDNVFKDVNPFLPE